jgi:hypothetical protein
VHARNEHIQIGRRFVTLGHRPSFRVNPASLRGELLTFLRHQTAAFNFFDLHPGGRTSENACISVVAR